MTSRSRRVAAGLAALAAAVWLGVAGATAQEVPTAPVATSTTVVTSTTVPAAAPPPEAPPPEEGAPPVPDPGSPAPPPTTAPAAPNPVAAPASSTTTTRPPANPVPPARATSSAPASLGIDLSEIAALRQEALGKGPRRAQRDFGFDPALPFQPGGGEAGGRTVEPKELGVEEDRLTRVRSVGAVAAGLLVLVLVGMAAWLLRQARPGVSPGGHT